MKDGPFALQRFPGSPLGVFSLPAPGDVAQGQQKPGPATPACRAGGTVDGSGLHAHGDALSAVHHQFPFHLLARRTLEKRPVSGQKTSAVGLRQVFDESLALQSGSLQTRHAAKGLIHFVDHPALVEDQVAHWSPIEQAGGLVLGGQQLLLGAPELVILHLELDLVQTKLMDEGGTLFAIPGLLCLRNSRAQHLRTLAKRALTLPLRIHPVRLALRACLDVRTPAAHHAVLNMLLPDHEDGVISVAPPTSLATLPSVVTARASLAVTNTLNAYINY